MSFIVSGEFIALRFLARLWFGSTLPLPPSIAADGDIITRMDIGPRARWAHQHTDPIAGPARRMSDRRAEESAGARDKDELLPAALEI